MQGMTDYLSHVLHAIQDTHPSLADTHTLRALLPSILLALVAGDTNLIISTPQPTHLQKLIGKILSLIFGLSVKRVRINATQSPSQLLDSLFIYPSSSHHLPPPRTLSDPRPPSGNYTEQSDSTLHNYHSLVPPLPRFLRHRTDPLFNLNDHPQLPRLPQVLIISHLERAGSAAHLALAEVLSLRQLVFHGNRHHNPLRGIWDLPDRFFTIYIAPLSPGEPMERPNIHPSLLDHFAFSATLGQFPHTNRPPSPSTGAGPGNGSIPPSPSPATPTYSPIPKSSSPPPPSPIFPYSDTPLAHAVHLSPLVSNYAVALISAARHHPELDGSLLTARCVKHVQLLLRASGIVFGQWSGSAKSARETSLVMEAHVRRIVPPALAHRLRVRDSPREQIMGLLWQEAGVKHWKKSLDGYQLSLSPAPPESGEPAGKSRENQTIRRSIKTILAEILADV